MGLQDLLVQMAQMALQALQDRQVLPDQVGLQALKAPPEQRVQPAQMGRMAQPGLQAQPDPQDLPEAQAQQGLPVQQDFVVVCVINIATQPR